MSTLQDDEKAVGIDIPATAGPTRSRVFRDAVFAELMQMRTLRSTRAFLAGPRTMTM